MVTNMKLLASINPDALYRFKPCIQSNCYGTTEKPCSYGGGNEGRVVTISKGARCTPYPDLEPVLMWEGQPFCPRHPTNRLAVAIAWQNNHFEEVGQIDQTISSPYVVPKDEHNFCPNCGIEGQWVAMALKCPKCWKTW